MINNSSVILLGRIRLGAIQQSAFGRGMSIHCITTLYIIKYDNCTCKSQPISNIIVIVRPDLFYLLVYDKADVNFAEI